MNAQAEPAVGDVLWWRAFEIATARHGSIRTVRRRRALVDDLHARITRRGWRVLSGGALVWRYRKGVA